MSGAVALVGRAAISARASLVFVFLVVIGIVDASVAVVVVGATVVIVVSVVIVAVRLTLGSLVVCLSLSSMADCWRLLFLVILLIV